MRRVGFLFFCLLFFFLFFYPVKNYDGYYSPIFPLLFFVSLKTRYFFLSTAIAKGHTNSNTKHTRQSVTVAREEVNIHVNQAIYTYYSMHFVF